MAKEKKAKTVKGKSKSVGTAVIDTPKPKKLETAEGFSCLRCHHDRAEELGYLPTQVFQGITESGIRYTSIERIRVMCEECSQQAIVKNYVFVANDWKE